MSPNIQSFIEGAACAAQGAYTAAAAATSMVVATLGGPTDTQAPKPQQQSIYAQQRELHDKLDREKAQEQAAQWQEQIKKTFLDTVERGNDPTKLLEPVVNARYPDNQDTALIRVCRSGGNIALVPTLLKHDADVNAVNKENQTALMFASKRLDKVLANMLLTKRALSDTQDSHGNTALINAVDMADREPGAIEEIVQLFITAGADLNKQNNRGTSAFIAVARNGYRGAFLRLLIAGAKTDLAEITEKGKITAQDYLRLGAELGKKDPKKQIYGVMLENLVAYQQKQAKEAAEKEGR